jgi:hypothetical protein
MIGEIVRCLRRACSVAFNAGRESSSTVMARQIEPDEFSERLHVAFQTEKFPWSVRCWRRGIAAVHGVHHDGRRVSKSGLGCLPCDSAAEA